MRSQILAVGLSVFAAAAFAHSGMHGPGSEFDLDQDGGLSLAEYKQYLQHTKQDGTKATERFAALDANKNAILTPAEFKKDVVQPASK